MLIRADLQERSLTPSWAQLFHRARLRKGWSYQRLACEAELSPRTVQRACLHAKCTGENAFKIAGALGLMLVLPQSQPMTAQQAQFGR